MKQKAPYRRIFEASNDAFLIFDLKGVVREANPAACEMYGYPYEEMIGLSGKDFVHPDCQYLFRKFVEETPSGKPFAAESVEIRKDGSTFNIEVRGNTFEYESEPHILAIIRDITERKRVEREIETKSEFLERLVQQSPLPTFVLDNKGICLVVNEAFLEFYAVPDKDLILGSNAVTVPQNIKYGVDKYIKEALKGNEIDVQEIEFISPYDNRKLYIKVKLFPVFDHEGKLTNVVSMQEDITDRKHAEEALRESEEKFRLLTENSFDCIWMLDTRLRFTYLSPSVEAILGYKPEHLIGTKLSLYFKKKEYLKVSVLAVKALKNYKTFNHITFETRMLNSNNEEVDVEITSKTLLNFQGKLIGLQGTTRDITERKKSEKEIRKLSEVVETSPEAVVITDMQGNIEYVNEGLLKLGGYKNDSLIVGNSIFLFSDEEGVRKLNEEIIPIILSEGKWRGEVTVKRSDGSTLPTEMICSSIPDEQGKPMHLLSQYHDITWRKNTEEQLRESEQKFRDMTNLLPQIVYEIDTEGNLTYINKQAFDSFGYSQEEYEKGINVMQTLIPSDRNRAKENIEKVLYGKDVGNPEYTVLRKDGSTFPILIYSSAILKDNIPVGLRGIIVDITERKQAEEERAQMEDQFRHAQKMESVGRLAGGVAHDFNNMLGVILGYTEMSLDKLDPSQPFYTALQEIRKAADRSADLTRQLLAFARRQTISPRVLDLNETVEGMLKMLCRLIGEDINLSWQPFADLLRIKVDPTQFDQILVNLCANGSDAISGVGKMTIETGKAAFDEDYCREHPGFVPGEYVLLAVSDDGCGMDKEIQDNIFEPFFTTKEVGQGTGLGLATVYGIVKQNDGFINIYSEPGKGTTFNIYLPRYAGKTVQIQDECPEEPISQGHETILLAEDEPAILEMATKMLKRQGYTVLDADTPGVALRLAREYNSEIHLLMTDVIMPEMNGRDLANKLASICPDIKCLFMSGYTANVIAHRRVLDDGVNFIQKPFSIQDLASKVREVLDAE